MIAVIITGVIAVILLIIFAANYNGLIGLRNKVKNAWAQIDILLKRRHDLMPNLVETVKGYKDFERSTPIRGIRLRLPILIPGICINRQHDKTAMPG